jgi:hypothetical protein
MDGLRPIGDEEVPLGPRQERCDAQAVHALTPPVFRFSSCSLSRSLKLSLV